MQFSKEHGFAGYFETPPDKQFKKLDVVQFSKEHGFAGYFEISAKTGTGITEALEFLLTLVCSLPIANFKPYHL